MYNPMEYSIEFLQAQGYKTPNFIERWSEPQRVYHGIGHIQQMLHCIPQVTTFYNLGLLDVVDLHLAAWYHDIVYVPGSKHNETFSAKAAQDEQPAGVGDRIARMVIATERHNHPDTFLTGILIDMDLQGLGADTTTYYKNNVKVRAEYGDMITDLQWLEGRIAFLVSFLTRPSIYMTSWGAQWEKTAGMNMMAELFHLRNL